MSMGEVKKILLDLGRRGWNLIDRYFGGGGGEGLIPV